MLTITVSVRGRVIAEATATNMSDLADVSDYEIRVIEGEDVKLGIQHLDVRSQIKDHRRKSSVWYLVGKISRLAISTAEKQAAAQLLYGIADVSDIDE